MHSCALPDGCVLPHAARSTSVRPFFGLLRPHPWPLATPQAKLRCTLKMVEGGGGVTERSEDNERQGSVASC